MWTEEFSEGTHFVACCLQLRYDNPAGYKNNFEHTPCTE